MKTLATKILKRMGVLGKSNLRKSFRTSQDSMKANYVRLVDENNNEIYGKLLDLSEEGCKIVFSNMQLFVNSEFIMDLKDSKTQLANQNKLNAKIVWSEHVKLDISRYCMVGLKFGNTKFQAEPENVLVNFM